jgi:hypothetical protein
MSFSSPVPTDQSFSQSRASSVVSHHSFNKHPTHPLNPLSSSRNGGGSLNSINSVGKKRKAPVPPKRIASINPVAVVAIPEESPSLVQRSDSERRVVSPAPAPRTSLETGVRPLSDLVIARKEVVAVPRLRIPWWLKFLALLKGKAQFG